MPIYEYICKDCERAFEKLVFNTKEKISCPHCGGRHNALQLSVVASPAKSAASPSYCETGGSTRPGGAAGMPGCGNCGCN
jgi:putative FmdB family regulatory protein